ncbi:MAG TPA: molybdopterin-binding protein [Candidatus Limnocylindrales bacterium]|nr:molybdopterin-binding protein [Candidatus Limnocylindrales bacterium]
MRAIHRAELFSVGSELTTGETRDTNAGELARDLTEAGVIVDRLTALPDELVVVRDAIAVALARADLVVTTGGLGPTPDDLTREAVAAAVGEEPAVGPELEAWLRGLFERRGVPFVEANRKQAWVIPSATSIPNDLGTAPGWWVDRPDGRVIVVLPGPPREMRPMWHGWVRARLVERGLGRPMAAVTLRTTGIGESLIADRLGALLAREADPLVATYARADAVDVRISAHERPGVDAAAAVAETEREVLRQLGDHVWARGTTTWPAAIEAELRRLGSRLSFVEVGTRGSLTALLGEGLGDRLALAESLPALPPAHDGHAADLPHLASRARDLGPAEIGLAVEARPRRGDTAVSVAIVDPQGTHRERRLVFLADELGRGRAALAAAAILLARLRGAPERPRRGAAAGPAWSRHEPPSR